MKREKCFRSHELLTLKNIICEKTGVIPKNTLLIQAFTRSSYSAEQGGENNEIFEFIGDQVLSYYVVKIISRYYGASNGDCEYTFRVRENRFSALKQEFLSNEALARIIDEWGVVKYLIVGKSDYMNNVDQQVKVKADLLEAIVGAIAVSMRWDSEVLEKAIERILSIEDRIKQIIETDFRPVSFDMENSVRVLKELSEHGVCTPPEYEYGTPEELGNDENGNPRWVCNCSTVTDRTYIIRQVWTSSKKAAKKAAAYLVLCDHFELQNEYGVNGNHIIWIFKDGKLMPEYENHERVLFKK